MNGIELTTLYEQIGVLMENFDKAMNLSTISANSAGSALDKFNIYQESTQAKLSELSNQFEIFATNIIDGKVIKAIIDLGKYFLMFANSDIGQVIIKTTLLITTLGLLSTGFSILNTKIMATKFGAVLSSISALITGTGSLTAVVNSLTGALAINPIFTPALMVGGIVAFSMALEKIVPTLDNQKIKVEELTDKLAGLKSEYEGLKNKADLTDLEKARLKLLESEIQANETLLKKEAERQYLMEKGQRGTQGLKADSQGKDIDFTIKKYKELQSQIGQTAQAEYDRQLKLANLTIEMSQHAQKLLDLKEKGVQLKEEDEVLLNVIQNLTSAQAENNSTTEEALPTYASIKQHATDYMTALDELTAIEEKNKNGASLSYEEKEKLIKQYPVLKGHVIATADGFNIEADALNTLKGTLKDTALAQIQADKDMITSAINRTRQILGLNKATIMSYQALMKGFLGEDVLKGAHGSSQGVFISPEQQLYLDQINQLKNIEIAMNEAEKMIETASKMGGGGGSKASSPKSTKSSEDAWKKAFDKQYQLLQHQLTMNEITEKQYLDKLDTLYKKYFAGKTKYTDEFMKYEEEVYTKRKKLEEDLLKERLEKQKEALEKQKSALNTLVDKTLELIKYEAEQEKDYYNSLIQEEQKRHDEVISNLKDEVDAKKEALENELDNYKKIIEAQLESLRLKEEERDFNKDLSEKQKELAKLQAELQEVSMDDTAEGRAKRLQLEEQIAKQKGEIDEAQHDREVELQENALENELKRYEESIQSQLDQYDKFLEEEEKRYEDSLDTRIKEYESHVKDIDNYLKKEGLLRQDARKRIEEGDKTLFDKLLEYNMIYGDGTKKSFTDIWETASQALDKYADKQLSVLEVLAELDSDITGIDLDLSGKGSSDGQLSAKGKEQLNQQKYLHDLMIKAKKEDNKSLQKWIFEERARWGMDKDGKIIKKYHTGGIVDDGQPLKSTEIMAKLLKGELVTTESQADNFIKNVLPKIAGVSSFGGGTGDIKVEMPINVAGNLDETVLPQLENMVEKVVGKINNAMFKRGNNRNAKALSI